MEFFSMYVYVAIKRHRKDKKKMASLYFLYSIPSEFSQHSKTNQMKKAEVSLWFFFFLEIF